jgi:uncharacterized protein (TIGR00730 family)
MSGKKIEKAYKNLDFLTSAEARTVRILSEFYEPQYRFRKHHIIDTVVFFGSARLLSTEDAKKELDKLKKITKVTPSVKSKIKRAEKLVDLANYYDDAVELSKRLTEWSKKFNSNKKRFIVCSGGGPGIMEAANKGAKLAGGSSIGLNISIPYEQFVNKYVDDELAFEFHYFFMRKFWFVYLAKALIAFPGGFGTLDELMEVLTLVQTGKIKKPMKIIVYGEKYWKQLINFDHLIKMGTINKSDLKLFDFCDNVDDAFDKIKTHFEKYYL